MPKTQQIDPFKENEKQSAPVKTNHTPSHNKKKAPPKKHQKGKKEEGKNRSK